MPPTRAEHRAEVTARILAIGRRHLAEHGAAALSLRAVTRELGMVSSAVYRYVASRDELLTLLLVEGYTDLGDAVDAAVAASSGLPARERLVTAGLAFRDWAVADPARYALLFGSPVPGFTAPADRTNAPGTRVPLLLLRLVAEDLRDRTPPAVSTDDGAPATGTDHATTPDDAVPDDAVPDDAGPPPLPAHLVRDLAHLAAEAGVDLPPDVLARATAWWSTLVGTTGLEVFGGYGADTFADQRPLLEHHLRLVAATL